MQGQETHSLIGEGWVGCSGN